MLKKMSDDEDPRSSAKNNSSPPSPAQSDARAKSRPMSWLKSLIPGRASNSNDMLQEALDDYIEDLRETDLDDASADNQKTLIANVLKTRDLRVSDIMIPRVDIVAIEHNATTDELKRIFKEEQYSRLPVYRDTLDNVIGTIHIKDVLACVLDDKPCDIPTIVREAMIVPPGLPIMDLFLMMREDKTHMALVVDEHGGIDGLVTMNDVIEAIVGDIEDEFDHDEQPKIIEKPDGSLVADARMEIEEFEERYGNFLTADEREDIQTLGGLAFGIAGRIPKRGESLKHSSGVVLDVLEADSRKVSRLRVRNLPATDAGDDV